MAWDKKNDGSKLNNLFTKRKNQGGLDYRRRDRDYIEAARAKHFPTVNSKNFVPIYNRKAAKIDVENKLKGVRKVNSGSISSLQKDGTDCDSDFAPGEESDEDLDYDEEDDFIEGGMEFGATDLASRFGRVSLNGTNNATVAKNIPICYNVSEELTWLIYDYVQEDNHYCCVDIMTLAMGRDKFRPRVSTNGRKVMVEIVKPKFFFEYERLENINSHNSNFNVNTHKATAYKAALREMRRGLGVRKGEEITGTELVIPLPFQCEVDIVEWGVQGHANEDLEICRITKDPQLYYILSMTFLSTEKAEEVEKKGTVKIVRKSPKKRVKSTTTRKKRKNDSFETASQGMPPSENVDIDVDDDNDEDLSEESE